MAAMTGNPNNSCSRSAVHCTTPRSDQWAVSNLGFGTNQRLRTGRSKVRGRVQQCGSSLSVLAQVYSTHIGAQRVSFACAEPTC